MARTKQTARKKKSKGWKAKNKAVKKAVPRSVQAARSLNKAKQTWKINAQNNKPKQKSMQNRQYGGRWRGNSRDQGSWGLSYENSQRATENTSSNFSSFFTPSNTSYVQSKVVELGLLIRKHWVGGLIGKKGKTINMIRDKSNGANIDFGNDDIIIDRSKDTKWEQSPWPVTDKEKYIVCAISGTKEQAAEAAKAIAEQLGKSAQSPHYRLEFLIPGAFVGVFIGKKGSNLKQMKGSEDEGVSINIRDEPIQLGSNSTTLCTLFGPVKGMLGAIERTAKWLGDISIKVIEERSTGQSYGYS